MTIAVQDHEQTMSRGEELLLEFLAGNDALCPVCRYNLRGLTRPTCPECKQHLVLTVGVERLGLGWFLLALVPGIAAGFFACLLAIPTTAIYFEDSVIAWPLLGGTLFGWVSGVFAILLALKWRTRFLALPHKRKQRIVVIIWTVHFIALVLFFFGFASMI